MKNLFLKISSSILAVLVVLSTLSLTVEKHYCGNFLVSVSYFGNTRNCDGKTGEENCNTSQIIKKKKCCNDETENIEGQDDLKNSIQIIKKKKCCNDETENIEGQDDLKNSIERFDVEKQQLPTLFLIPYYYSFFSNAQKQANPHQYYLSPNLTPDLQILFEVFII